MGRLGTIESLTEKAHAAFRQTAVKVIERAKQTGTPVIVWENGQVAIVATGWLLTSMVR